MPDNRANKSSAAPPSLRKRASEKRGNDIVIARSETNEVRLSTWQSRKKVDILPHTGLLRTQIERSSIIDFYFSRQIVLAMTGNRKPSTCPLSQRGWRAENSLNHYNTAYNPRDGCFSPFQFSSCPL